MRLFLKLFLGLFALMIMGCAAQIDESYTPSIAALEANETLVMKLSACHWGCTKGSIKFKNNKAKLGLRNIELTSKEIDELDHYFLYGPEIAIQERCSLPVEISFELKNRFRSINTKDTLVYPCPYYEGDKISPLTLVEHFKKTPRETPLWRLSPKERTEKLNHVLIISED